MQELWCQEHWRDQETNHIIDWEGAKILDKETNRRTRQINEANWIRKTMKSMKASTGKRNI